MTTSPLTVGLIGADARTTALARLLDPGGLSSADRFHARGWAPGPHGEGAAEIAVRAPEIGASPVATWQALADDPGLDVIAVGVAAGARESVVRRALESGKTVLCAPPVAVSLAELARLQPALDRGGHRLLAPGDLRHTAPGAHALDIIGRGELGDLHHFYGAVRGPVPAGRQEAADVVMDLGSDLLDFALAAVSGPIGRVYASAGRLFASGGARDTAVVILRFVAGPVVTIEISRCLPPGIPAPEEGEVEIEIGGSIDALRLEPGRPALQVSAGGAPALRPWVPEPIAAILEELWNTARGQPPRADYPAQQRRLLEVMDAIDRSLETGEVVSLAPLG